MFKLLQAVFITLMVAACSTTGSINTSKNTAIDLGSFLVEGTGAKLEDAKTDGFRKAIELAVGVAILSERESVNNKMAKQYILSHSSGYVEKFVILDTQVVGTNPSKYKVMMRVFVKPTMVDDYVMYQSKDAKDIDGHRAAANVNTYLDSRASGGEMLNAVLKDFPEKAYEVHVYAPRVTVDNKGDPSIDVDYKIKLSDKFLKSLDQVLDRIKERDCSVLCGENTYKLIYKENPNDFIPKFKTHYFNDSSKPQLIYEQLYNTSDSQGNRFVAKMDYLDSSGTILATACDATTESKARNGNKGLTALLWSADYGTGFNVNWVDPRTNTRPYRNILSSLSKVEITIVRPWNCKRK